mgnify:CR=1 FL=1
MVVDAGVKAGVKGRPKVQGGFGAVGGQVDTQSLRRQRIALQQFIQGEGQKVKYGAAAGQGLGDLGQQQKVLRPGENEPAGPVFSIHDALDIGKQIRDLLDFIDDDIAPELA